MLKQKWSSMLLIEKILVYRKILGVRVQNLLVNSLRTKLIWAPHKILTVKNYPIVTHQSAARIGVPNKANNIAVFDILDVRKIFLDIDADRYARDGVNIDYASNDYLDQYSDL